MYSILKPPWLYCDISRVKQKKTNDNYALPERYKTKQTLHISTLLRASSISSLRESALATTAWLLDFVAWYHLADQEMI